MNDAILVMVSFGTCQIQGQCCVIKEGLMDQTLATKQKRAIEALIVQGAYASESPETVVSTSLPHVNSSGVDGRSDDLSLHIGPIP